MLFTCTAVTRVGILSVWSRINAMSGDTTTVIHHGSAVFGNTRCPRGSFHYVLLPGRVCLKEAPTSPADLPALFNIFGSLLLINSYSLLLTRGILGTAASRGKTMPRERRSPVTVSLR